jgi:hypothetical protein
MSYSDEYKKLFADAVTASVSLGFKRGQMVSTADSVEQSTLVEIREALSEFSNHLNLLLPRYWGNSCQTLSAQIFAFLNSQGIAADIVLGDVSIEGTDVFNVTLDGLTAEYLTDEPLTGSQSLHAWISVGDDSIIDAAMPPRLAKNHGFPEHISNAILVSRASLLAERYELRYKPIIVGAEYFAKTNPPDPFVLMERWKSMRA